MSEEVPATLRTLIVDDEPLAIERMQVLCAEIDSLLVVGTASDGESALRLATKLSPDLLLLDMTMPGMDGLAVAPSAGKVTIVISAREEYGRLVVTVADDGANRKRSAEPRPGFGIGLGNVEQRLAARFGDEAGVVSGPTSEGYATHIRLPLVGEKRAAA